MTYRELLKHLQGLTSDQLDQDVVTLERDVVTMQTAYYVTDVGYGKQDDYFVDDEVLHVGQFYLEVG